MGNHLRPALVLAAVLSIAGCSKKPKPPIPVRNGELIQLLTEYFKKQKPSYDHASGATYTYTGTGKLNIVTVAPKLTASNELVVFFSLVPEVLRTAKGKAPKRTSIMFTMTCHFSPRDKRWVLTHCRLPDSKRAYWSKIKGQKLPALEGGH